MSINIRMAESKYFLYAYRRSRRGTAGNVRSNLLTGTMVAESFIKAVDVIKSISCDDFEIISLIEVNVNQF